MAEISARHDECLFGELTVVRSHPYVHTEPTVFDNHADAIPLVNYPEVLKVLIGREKKRSCDAHSLSPSLRPHPKELSAFLRAHVQPFIFKLCRFETIKRRTNDSAREERCNLSARTNATNFAIGLVSKSPRALISQ